MSGEIFSFKKIREVISWPELRGVWPILILLAFVFAAGYSLSLGFIILQGGLIVITAALTFALVYRVADIERKNKVERNQFKSVLSGLEDALVVYDNDFKILFFNPVAERLFKLDSKTVVNHEFTPQDTEKPPLKLLTQVIFPSLAPEITSRSVAGQYPQVADLSFAEPVLDLRVSTLPVNDENGKLLGFMKIIHDRTRELSLIRSKNEFLTVASHQLRTPVTELNWGLEVLASDKTLSGESKNVVGNSLAAGKELLKIVEDLLNIAKIEEGRFGYNFEEADAVDFVNGILLQAIPVARRAGIKIYFEKPKAPLPKLMIDSQKLLLAVNNILENAVRYNVEGGEVTVKIDKVIDEPFVEISVRDTGIGIAPQDMDKLFKKFFRADNALKTKTEGSGLGLYIAKNIIQAHGGKIWADSELGRGTVLHFTLPTDPGFDPGARSCGGGVIKA